MAVTIKDVAKAAGTSTATVSKVLSGSSTISQATSLRVRRVVKELQYQPNVRAQSFARQATHTVFFLMKPERDIAFVNPHVFEIMLGAQCALDQKGYNLCLKGVAEKEACSFVEQAVARKSADGIILHASVVTKKLAALVTKCGMPHILIGQPNFESQLCWIDTNNYLSGEIAARHLIDQGYRSIAFIGGKPDDMISWNRLRGVRTALEENHIPFPPNHVKQGDSTFSDGQRMTKLLLKGVNPPRAIICANNYIALGCMQALQEKNISVPGQMAVMTFDSFPFSTITEPMLTVVDINVFDMGKQAGQWILDKIRKPNLQVQAYTTLPELIVRASTATPASNIIHIQK